MVNAATACHGLHVKNDGLWKTTERAGDKVDVGDNGIHVSCLEGVIFGANVEQEDYENDERW